MSTWLHVHLPDCYNAKDDFSFGVDDASYINHDERPDHRRTSSSTYTTFVTTSTLSAKKKSKKKKKTKKTSSESVVTDYLDDFFAAYPAFDYSRTASSTQEFYRMCDFFLWDRDDFERQIAHDGFKTALVKQFNSLYGTDVDNIKSWQGLCLALEAYPPPEDVHKAKEMFRRKYVNLVDLVDRERTGESVIHFQTLNELQDYTIETGKFFPKESAYAGGMLRFLLREILNKHQQGINRRRRF
ncbi:MAG: hypothetical protein M1817_004736 [Caeruleum heppii]|nr:MAG: hypothetical protein M1817_004736 [Caeruleum heppii]